MSNLEGAEWGEALRDRVKACQEIVDLDIAWEKAIKSRADMGVFHAFARWWVHWRMRELVRQAPGTMSDANTALKRFGMRPNVKPIAQWPEEWWRPIPWEEREAYWSRKQKQAGVVQPPAKGEAP